MRFRTHLALLVLSLATPPLVLGSGFLLREAQERRLAELQGLANQAQALAAAVDQEIAGMQKAAEVMALALTPEELQEPERLRTRFQSMLALNPAWFNVVLLRPGVGQVLNTLAAPGMVLPEMRPPPVPGLPMPAVSDPFIGRLAGAPLVTVNAPIPAAGEAGWVVGIGIRTHHFESVIASVLPAGALAGVVGANGRFVAHTSTPQGDRTAALAPPEIGGFAATARPGTATTLETRRVTGQKVDAALHRTAAAPWTAVVALPREVIDAAVWRAVRGIALVGGLALVAALLAAVLLGQRLGRRVTALARAAEATGRGEAVPVPDGVAELDGVAAALARAAAEVRAREAEIRRLGEDRLRLAHQIARIGSFDQRLDEPAAVVTPEYAAISGLPDGTTTDTRPAAMARVHPEDRAAHERMVREALEGDASGYEAEFRIVRPSDGAVRRIACRAEIRRGPGGRARRLIGVIRDVTEERAAAEGLRRLNAELEARVREEVAARQAAQVRAAQAERMQALGQLAGGIAHDFNNVLQAVQGGAALIERRPGDAAGVRRLARMMLDATGRGVTVTRRLLSFARRDELRAEPVEPSPLLAGLCEVLAHTLGAEIACRHEVAPGTPPLLADKGQLETVLVNLASNARDAMPQGGTLTISAEEAVLEGGSGPAGLLPGRYVRITARDTGTGMDPATVARLGEPFFTTKPRGAGTGLGLSMAKGFAEQSGGALTVESAPGKGTVVSLWLPPAPRTAEAPPPDADPAAAGAEGSAASPHRVLVVDDEPIVREVLSGMLEAAGYAVLTAEGGAEALQLLDAGEAVDVLVSDLSMPGMGGVALIEAAQARRPSLPAVLLTGYAGDGASIAISGALSGTYSLLRKPVGEAQLIERIEALMAVQETAQG
ncbi:ATP-binding protein [Roseomonas populi]|uniref:histidine kinase n=1 Tax=Roseomonas populi TaxID=3121582 RepID=A0ABT1X700_9PROT|nr:ATP-binding protein [Roseomonas pecuniae]MCR0983876.1 response regulator [Roseomonas pecuniae]